MRTAVIFRIEEAELSQLYYCSCLLVGSHLFGQCPPILFCHSCSGWYPPILMWCVAASRGVFHFDGQLSPQKLGKGTTKFHIIWDIICIWICCFHWTVNPAWLNGLQRISDWKMSTVEWNRIMNFECTQIFVRVWQRAHRSKFYKTHIKKSADSFMHKQLIGLRIVLLKICCPREKKGFTHPPR